MQYVVNAFFTVNYNTGSEDGGVEGRGGAGGGVKGVADGLGALACGVGGAVG